MELKGLTAIVNGGASGLGEACVYDLTRNEAKVSIFDFAEDRGERIASEIGDAVIFCKTDVTSEKSVQTAINKTIKDFGGIHLVVNCAGIEILGKVLGKKGPISIELVNRVIQVNLIGTINVIRLASEKMIENTPNKKGERGVIVNTGSIAAFEGPIGQVAYSASKAGIAGMTLPLAREFASFGIRVMTIASCL